MIVLSCARYAYLLEAPKVKRWNVDLAWVSQITADIYLRGLDNFCETNARVYFWYCEI